MNAHERREVVLGINLGHDRSACVAVDGEPRVAVAEERLSRRKHNIPLNDRGERYNVFPRRSVDYCLSALGLGYPDVDLVVGSTTYVLDTATGARRNLEPADIAAQCAELRDTRIETVPHHVSHAASVGPCSGFEDAAVLVVDGGGSIVGWGPDGPTDFERTTLFGMRGRALTPVIRVVGGPPGYGNSIGDFYQALTVYLGFRRGEEGKTMGLAGYRDTVDASSSEDTTGGRTATPAGWQPLPLFRDAIRVRPDCTHEVDERFQFTVDGGFHPEIVAAFGPPRTVPLPDDPLDRHIAASAQWALETALLQLVGHAHRLTGQSRLCLAGGVALNCVANGRILAEGPFDALFVQPAAGDDGAALGNALLGIQRLTGRPASWQFGSPYLGRSYRDEEINDAVLRAGDRVIVETPDDLAPRIADDIAAGRIVAVFRGGCEYGPRALGHRSILCDPRPTWMKDHVNARVKHREAFRPFAPMVLQERAAEYFAPHVASPYMLLTATVLHPDLLPGITHVDGSARVQTVSREQELFLHEVISRFSDRTGLPVLLNTSFNDQEPIVETPDDAIACFCGTGIDVLYLEGLRVTKPGTQW